MLCNANISSPKRYHAYILVWHKPAVTDVTKVFYIFIYINKFLFEEYRYRIINKVIYTSCQMTLGLSGF